MFRLKEADLGLALFPALGTEWTTKVSQESCSPAYGQKAASSLLNFSADVLLPAAFATLLVAWEGAHCGIKSFTQAGDEDQALSSFRCTAEDGEYLLVFGEKNKPSCRHSLSSDAEFVCWKSKPGDGHLILYSGSYAQVDGGPELRCSRPVEWAELILSEHGRTVFSSDRAAILEVPSETQQPAVAAPSAQ